MNPDAWCPNCEKGVAEDHECPPRCEKCGDIIGTFFSLDENAMICGRCE